MSAGRRSSSVGALSVALAVASILSVSARAQEADADDQGLEEVVITAQKRTEKLEDVPVAAAVLSSDALASSNVSDVADVNKLVPSVNLNGTINGRVPMGVRGISSISNEQTVGIASGVALLLDGVPVPSDSFAANVVEDVQNIEVLKGPQSTLGGRSAAAGVINMVTRGPSDTLQGSLGTTLTNDGEYRVNGFVSGPLTDSLTGSLALNKSKRDYDVTNIQTSEKTDQSSESARAKLKWQATDNLSIGLMANYNKVVSKGFNFVYTYLTSDATLLNAPPLTQDVVLAGITPSDHNLSYSSPVTDAGHYHIDHNYSVNVDYDLGGGYTLSSTTAYLRERQQQVQDLFATSIYFFDYLTGGNATFNDTQTQTALITQTSEELKLVSPLEQKVSYVAGLFYSTTKVDSTLVRPFVGAPVDTHVTPTTATYDLYGRATWNLTDANALVVGLRFNHDVLKYADDQTVYTTDASYGPYYSEDSASSNAVVGDLSFQHKYSDSQMAYATYARGYSPAAYNTSAVLKSADAKLPLVGQEHINHFEVGSKGTYLNNRLSLNADVFYTVYRDFQIQSCVLEAGSISCELDLDNAGQASTRGVEADLSWAATRDLRLGVNAAYIDAKFDDYKDGPCSPDYSSTCSQDLSGKTMPNSPKFKYVLSAEQRVPLDAIPVALVFGGNYSYRSSAQMLTDQNAHTIQPGFGILNLSAGVESNSGKWSATAFVNNVTDKLYYVDIEDFWSSPWTGDGTSGPKNAVISQPARDAKRYAGIRFNVNL
ncbi:MAG: TonB-dependent receptor [Steroidobacteraceae bacterium]